MVRTIDREKPVPLYKQLEEILREKITLGDFPSGSRLPSETQLCDRYDVSRITVRQALDELTREELIQRVQGKGTIVTSQERKPLIVNSIKGFKKSVADQNTHVHSEILSSDLVMGDSSLLDIFNLPVDKESEFMRIRRLRYVNDMPCAILTSYVRKEIGEKMQEFDLTTASFYDLIETIIGLKIIYNRCTYIPVAATSELCNLLKVNPGSAHFYFRGISYAEGDIPIELANGYFHGEKFEMLVTIPQIRLVRS
jgi:GntR family transcriptional regulator